MFIEVIKDIVYFILILFFLVLIFTIIQIILQADASGIDDDYKGVDKLFRMFLQTFRISIGDLQIIDYTAWKDPNDDENGIAKFSNSQ